MLRKTLSVLQSSADKPCFEKHWHEYSSTNFSLFMVAFLNTVIFLSPLMHKKWAIPADLVTYTQEILDGKLAVLAVPLIAALEIICRAALKPFP